ncbi:hypothetical protein L4C33_20080 [Vibrio makurazakiensis]|uniref:hypothetical protein n=1 Tax=Vibrio makurazakiensis TaxID=2910250 RepID=UPI003D0A7F06
MNKHILHSLCLMGSLSLIGCSSINGVSNDDTTSAQASQETIAKWVENQILAPEGLSLADNNIRYRTGSADLNADDSFEHIVLMQDPYFCGSGGCTAVMFNNSGEIINQMTVVKTPVVLADSYSNGWQDFIVWSNGAYRVMSYNGETYPSNPSLEPTTNWGANTQAAIAYVMATELYQQDGYDIMPSEDVDLWTKANTYNFTFKHYGNPDSIYNAAVDMNTGEVDIKSTPIK